MKKITLISFLVFCCLQISAQFAGKGWYRVHNSGSSSGTKRYLTVIGNEYKVSTDPDAFYGCIKTIADPTTDPGSVIYVNATKVPNSNTILYAQGVDTYTLTGQELSVKEGGNVDGRMTYIPYVDYFIYKAYLQIYGNNPDIGRQDTYAHYWLEPLTEANRDTYYFGVKPLSKIKDGNGDYWTTLYAGFAFKIPDIGGVEAAYVIEGVDSEGGDSYVTPVKKWGRGQTVPRATPVLLQCKSTDPAVNVLIPTGTPNSDTYNENNLLKGAYFCLTEHDYNNVTPNNQTKYRVLNVSPTTGKIGFFKYSGTNMSANKAYLVLPSNMNASKLYINFDGITDQDEEEPMVSEDGGFPDSIEAIQNGEYHGVVYDLQGRRVSSENLTKGIYIVNGKKVFIQ